MIAYEFDTAWIGDYKGVAYASFPNCTPTNLWLAHYINRQNWREMLNGDQLVPPFYTMDIGTQSEIEGWSGMAGNTYVQPVDLYGIFSSSDPSSVFVLDGVEYYDPITYMNDAAHNFRENLLAYPSTSTGVNFGIYPSSLPVIDISVTMLLNRIFTVQGAPLWAVRVASRLIIGATN